MREAELLHDIARQTMTYPFKVWGFGEGIALEALWEAGERLDTPAYRAFVIDRFEHWLRRESRIVEADHSAPGGLLLTVYEATGDARYLDLALDLAEYMAHLPEARTSAKLHRPQHPDYHDYLYVDCMEVDAPFLCQLGRVTGNEAYFNAAVEQLLGYAALLADEATGLFYHQYDAATDRVNGAFWGRGNGWALLGMLKTLRLLPAAHPRYREVAEMFERLAAALATRQAPDGNWATVLDRAETYHEASLPAMFGYGLADGMAAGFLPDTYQPVTERAWTAMSGWLQDGLLHGVSVATPPGNADHYNRIERGAGYPWGQGPCLMFALSRFSVASDDR